MVPVGDFAVGFFGGVGRFVTSGVGSTNPGARLAMEAGDPEYM